MSIPEFVSIFIQLLFNFFERISWPDGNWYIFKTSAGKLILKDDNLAEITFVEEFAQNLIGSNKLEKIWPVDLHASSNNIDERIIKDEDECLAFINYGSIKLPATIKKNKIYGCQFHPEKSGEVGLNIINNFLNLG